MDGNPVDDATWILTSSFVILTMQSGFGLLEAGYVQRVAEVNIMMKNAVDVSVGGIAFWMFGYGLAFGEPSNPFCGFGNFFVGEGQRFDDETSGWLYSKYIFQFSFAATATTIFSGCVAQRYRFSAYIIFSFVNCLIYAIPAHWVWDDRGWLCKLGFHDFAGDGPVHVLGACNGVVGAWMLGPRLGHNPRASSANTATSGSSVLLGLFVLWWGWIGFNCGSTFGLSGSKWAVAGRVAVTTINASCAGGVTGLVHSGCVYNMRFSVDHFVAGTLGALVAITAPCASCSPRDSVFIGVIGAEASIWGIVFIRWLGLDDPVGSIGAHGVAGAWGLLAVALFSQGPSMGLQAEAGLLYGGRLEFLGIQALGLLAVAIWSLLTSFLTFKAIACVIGTLRLTEEEEKQGADITDHMFSERHGFEFRSSLIRQATRMMQQMRSSSKESSILLHDGPAVLPATSLEDPTQGQAATVEISDPENEGEDLEAVLSSAKDVLSKLEAMVTAAADESGRHQSPLSSASQPQSRRASHASQNSLPQSKRASHGSRTSLLPGTLSSNELPPDMS